MIRTIISIVGLLAVCFLVWFGGPFIGIGEARPMESVAGRLVGILMVVVIWALNMLRQMLKANKVTKELLAGFKKGDEPAPAPAVNDGSGAEVQTLEKNFAEAVKILNKTKLGGLNGELKLYELPWYIIIGPPGAGKTTALINSGLRFPLANRFGQQALRGVGGTRDCDWWFTDEAVLIDTAGRYTTQDSDVSVDSAGWNGFLNLLKVHRKRRPINGIIVAISLAELLTQSESERLSHAAAIKQRIQELHEKLGIRFPIYVLFTKIDLVAGFVEFFDDLGREERDQVWGLTFPIEAMNSYEGVINQFAPQFDKLIQRLHTRVVSRIHQERDQARRALIHGFPHQMAALKSTADKFLQEVFRPNRFEDQFMLRGVYFTSGTQEGTPIDRVMASLANTFGLNRQLTPAFSGQGRSYFLTKLFREILFQESGIAGSDRKLEKQRSLIQYGGYVSAALVVLAATVIWSGAYTSNENHIKNMKDQFNRYKEQMKHVNSRSDVFDVLPAVNTLQDIANEYQEESWAWLTGLALSKRGSIEPVAHNAYRRAVLNDFLPRVKQRLEAQMQGDNEDLDFLTSTLKTYLMLGLPERREPEFIKLWLGINWETVYPNDELQQGRLNSHVDSMLKTNFEPLAMNDRLIESTRRILTRIPIEKRIYSRMKQEGMQDTSIAVNLEEVIGEDGRRTFRSLSNKGLRQQVSGLYSHVGFKELYIKDAPRFIKESTEEDWVIGIKKGDVSDLSETEIQQRLARLYLDDYIKSWQDLLGDLEVVKFDDLRHASDVVATLASATSPVRLLLETVDENTALEREGDSEAVDAATKLIAKKAKRLAKAAKAAKKAGIGGSKASPGAYIHETFEPIQDFVTPEKEGAPVPVDAVLGQLAELHSFLDEIASDTTGNAAFQAAKARMLSGNKDPIGKLRAAATRMPEPAKRWMFTVSAESWNVILGRARSYINSAWQAEVVPEYERRLKDRYPLVNSSQKEVTLSDFATFFGPDGTLDTFYNNYLQPFVKKTRDGLSLNFYEKQALGLSSKSINALERGNKIKTIYFADNNNQPMVPFSLKPIFLDAAVTKFSLELDGQQLSYRHGPQRAQQVQWPGPDGASQARLIFEAATGNRMTRTKEGPWALFRLLDQAEVKPGNVGDRLKVTFEMNGHVARYELQANSVANPFQSNAISQFRVPEIL